ncbi:MAG TPA: four-carbon acid sugar kinase family protein [Verrucomicrobiae bacterium]
MTKLLLTFYGDDFTGSTDAMEQLTLAGIRTVLFVEPPTPAQLKQFPNLRAAGVAGMTRAMAPDAIIKTLRLAFQKLKKLGARHTHYKVCSTFDSSPQIGSIGRVLEIGSDIFPAPFVPILAAAPALGRYTIFGNHFARFGIGSNGEIHRLDRHPSISRHPVTPMMEADLRLHLATQTKKKIALFDILKLALPESESFAELKKIAACKPDAILFDALDAAHLQRIGTFLDQFAAKNRPLFSIGSSGIEAALAGSLGKLQQRSDNRLAATPGPAKQLLVGSGSCSPVTSVQIHWALKRGFAEVPLDPKKLTTRDGDAEIQRAIELAVNFLKTGRSVIVHTTRKFIASKLKNKTAEVLGPALGRVLRGALGSADVQRVCVAGGDTSSFASRALGIEALEMIAPLTPGAPVCKVSAPGSPADGHEFVFKGGQVGAENYFEIVKRGRI